MHYAFYRGNNKDADQTAHMRSLISAFAIRMLQNNGFFDGDHLYYMTDSALDNLVHIPAACYLSYLAPTLLCINISVLSCTRITLYKHII